jgi:hypothetical protein
VAIVGVLPPLDLGVLFGRDVDVALPFPLTDETVRDGNTSFGG